MAASTTPSAGRKPEIIFSQIPTEQLSPVERERGILRHPPDILHQAETDLREYAQPQEKALDAAVKGSPGWQDGLNLAQDVMDGQIQDGLKKSPESNDFTANITGPKTLSNARPESSHDPVMKEDIGADGLEGQVSEELRANAAEIGAKLTSGQTSDALTDLGGASELTLAKVIEETGVTPTSSDEQSDSVDLTQSPEIAEPRSEKIEAEEDENQPRAIKDHLAEQARSGVEGYEPQIEAQVKELEEKNLQFAKTKADLNERLTALKGRISSRGLDPEVKVDVERIVEGAGLGLNEENKVEALTSATLIRDIEQDTLSKEGEGFSKQVLSGSSRVLRVGATLSGEGFDVGALDVLAAALTSGLMGGSAVGQSLDYDALLSATRNAKQIEARLLDLTEYLGTPDGQPVEDHFAKTAEILKGKDVDGGIEL